MYTVYILYLFFVFRHAVRVYCVWQTQAMYPTRPPETQLKASSASGRPPSSRAVCATPAHQQSTTPHMPF